MSKQGLNLNDTIHYNKWTKYGVLFNGNVSAVGLRPAFKTQAHLFLDNMLLVLEVSDRANVDLDGITASKTAAKQDASDAIGLITGNVFAFAGVKKLKALKKQMRNSTTAKLSKLKDENFVSACNNINTTVTGLLTDYADAVDFFTALQMSDAMLVVEDFDGKLGTWAVAETDVNAAKYEFATKWMPEMADNLEMMEMMLPGTITTTYPKFASSYLGLKKLVKVGVKAQGVQATMEDATTGDLFINDGRMETLNYIYGANPKVEMTNSLGEFKMMKLKVGIWKIKFSAPGYEDQIIDVIVKAKKTTEIDVQLEAVVV